MSVYPEKYGSETAAPAKRGGSAGRIVCRVILILLSIAWMAFIYRMSAMSGEQSDNVSGRLVLWIVRNLRMTDGLSDEAASNMLTAMTFFVRKTAHFTEFMILGGLLSGVTLTFREGWFFRFLAAFLAGACYAVSDEIHQLFVSDRSMQVFDMLIDAAGVFFGVLLVLGIAAMCCDPVRGRKSADPLPEGT